MTDESTPNLLPAGGGWATKSVQSPGATDTNESLAPAADCWASKRPQSPGATEDETDGGDVSRGRGERFASFGALLSAFIASSWCWLPPLLILGGISGAGMVTFLQDYRPIFMVVTFAFLGLAFYLTYRPRRARVTNSGDEQATIARASQSRSRIMTFNKIMLWVVTVIVIAFLFFPQTAASLSAPSDEFTADMQKTVVAIEGMT